MELKKFGILNISLISVIVYLYKSYENGKPAANEATPISGEETGGVALRLCCLMMVFSIFPKAYLHILLIGTISLMLSAGMEQHAELALILFLCIYSVVVHFEKQPWTTSVIGTLTLTSACYATTDMAHHGLVHIYNNNVHDVFLWDTSMLDMTGFKTIFPMLVAMYIKIYEALTVPYKTKEENFINLFSFHCVFNGVTILIQVAITTIARITGDVWYFNPLSGEAIEQDLNFLDWHVVGVMTCSAVVWTIAYFRLMHWRGQKLSPTVNTFQKILVNVIFPIVQVTMTISGIMLTYERQKTKGALIHWSTVFGSFSCMCGMIYCYNFNYNEENMTLWTAGMIRMYTGGVQTRLSVMTFQILTNCAVYNNAATVFFQVCMFGWTFIYFFYATENIRNPITYFLILFVFSPFWTAVGYLVFAGGNVCVDHGAVPH